LLRLLAVALAMAGSLGAAPSPDVKELIQSYRQSIQPFEHVAYAAECRITRQRNGQAINATLGHPVPLDKAGRAIFRILYRRDGDRLDIIYPKTSASEADVLRDPSTQMVRSIILGDLWQTLAGENPQRGNVSQQSAKINKLSANELLANARSGSLCGGEALDGWITGRLDESLPETFAAASDASVDSRPQVMDGHNTRVVRCTTNYGEFTVWLDPEVGCQPRRVEARRIKSGHIGNENAIRSETVENIQYQMIQGRPVGVSAHISGDVHRPTDNGTEVNTWVNEYSRTEVDFHPDFAAMKAFVMVAPPDYPAINIDLPEIRWKLVDGKFVPATDEAVIQSVDRMLAEAGRGAGSAAETTRPSGDLDRLIAEASNGGLADTDSSQWSAHWEWIVATAVFLLGGILAFLALVRRKRLKRPGGVSEG
jgi:hypothetical protein